MQTTASRSGLERFFDVVWPTLNLEPDRLMVVGDLDGAGDRLRTQLQRVTCTGFVKDLRQVLRPYDVNIIPWEHNTGQRTRLPVAFNHGQVVVAVRASVACFPEAEDGVNCRLVSRLEEMPGVISQLLHNSDERERLGRSARTTFEQSFSKKASHNRLQAAIETLPMRSLK
jgi:glycosyltransferase involved in cell wall biosynthesis